MTFSKIILALSLVGFLGTGCTNSNSGSPAEETKKETPENGENNGSSTDDNKETEQEGETSFTFSASMQHNLLGGGKERRVFNYDFENERLEILLPLPAGLNIGVEGSLPNHPEVSIAVDFVRDALVISFPLKNYLNVIQNPSGLPSGQPLPGINGGEPPSFGFPLNFGDLNAYGYAAFDSISLFVELDFNKFISLRTALKAKDGTQVGTLYVFPSTNGNKGGVFLTLSLPDELSVIIANAQ